MLRNSCLVLLAVVKQQQEETSCNHAPSLFALLCTLAVQILVKTTLKITGLLKLAKVKGILTLGNQVEGPIR